MKQSQKLRLVIRVFRSSFAQKSFSILLDTHRLTEQDDVEVSPFEARLPLRSPKAVSLKVKLHIEREEGTTCPLFIPSSAALPPVRRTGLQTQDARGSKGNNYSRTTRSMRVGILNFSKRRTTMSESNKNVVRRLFEEVWNKGNLKVTDELC